MVFAHGFGCDQNIWRLLIPSFVEHHRVVLFDHAGSGACDPSVYDPVRQGTLLGYTDDVELDETDLELRPGDALVVFTDGVPGARRGDCRHVQVLRATANPYVLRGSGGLGGRMSRPKHATASVFFFTRAADGWRIGLITHPRFAKQMLPGGHVEDDENPAEAAVREVTEETGLPAYLVSPPGIGEPADASAPGIPAPLWIVEQVVPPETRCPVEHVHIDHLYLALAPAPDVPEGAELRFRWFKGEDLDGLDMFDDTRVRALHLFARLSEPAGWLTSALPYAATRAGR